MRAHLALRRRLRLLRPQERPKANVGITSVLRRCLNQGQRPAWQAANGLVLDIFKFSMGGYIPASNLNAASQGDANDHIFYASP